MIMAYTDNNAIGQITEVNGEAIVIRTDGTEEVITLGTEIYLGDVVETTGDGAVNINFTDESSFAISDNARVAIDEYVFDPASESGGQDFTVSRGVFMYTSGLIGRENPDSVEIDTPVGSIGIRGTIIGGQIFDEGQGESQITVVEGAIVVRNDVAERLLTNQFDTVKLSSMSTAPSIVEQLDVSTVAKAYGAVKGVSSSLFSSFNDQIQNQGVSEGLDESSANENAPADDAKAEDGNKGEGPNVEAKPENISDAAKEALKTVEEKLGKSNESNSESDNANNSSNSNNDHGHGWDHLFQNNINNSRILSLSINEGDKYNSAESIEGFMATEIGDSSEHMGTNIATLTVAGAYARQVTAEDFTISGDNAEYLRVVQADDGTFSLALDEDVTVMKNEDGLYQLHDAEDGFVGEAFELKDVLNNFAQVSITMGRYVTDTVNLDIAFDATGIDASALAVSIDVLDQYNAINSVEGFLATNPDNPDDFMGSRVATLTVSGDLADNVTVSDFTIGGANANYLQIIEESDGTFSLALQDDVTVMLNSDGLYQLYDADDGFVGDSFALDTVLTDFADISLSQDSYPSNSISIDVEFDAASGNATYDAGGAYNGADNIIGIWELDGIIEIKENFDFNLIDPIGGQDKMILNDHDEGTATLFDFSAPDALAVETDSPLKNLSSIERIVFGNTDDTLKIDLENVLRLLQSSDLVEDGIQEIIIKQGTTDAVEGVNTTLSNGVTFTDDAGNVIQLDEEHGFTDLGQEAGDDGSYYNLYQHDMGIVKIESNIAGADTGGL